jgi:hypothetical protein
MLSRLHTILIIAADDGDPSVRHVPVDEISILNSPHAAVPLSAVTHVPVVDCAPA